MNTPIVAVKAGEISDFRRALDLNSLYRIKVYDLNAQRVIFITKKYKDIVDYDISPDGDSMVLITKKKMKLYNVNSQKDKKK